MTEETPATKSQPSVVVCYATCWSCKFGYCFEPPQEHPWFSSEDEEGRAKAGLAPLEGNCACSCAQPGEQ